MKGIRKVLLALSAAACALALSVGGALGLTTADAASGAVHSHGEAGYCLVCDVADKVNALPSASDITIENAAEVTQQIHDIDRIKYDMTDGQFEEFSTLVSVGEYGYVYKYYEAVQAIQAIDTGVEFVISKDIVLEGEGLQDTQEVEISFEIVNLDTAETTTLTLFDLGVSTSELGADYYAQTAGGWAFKYKLPVGRYEVTEINSAMPTLINGRYWSNTSVSVESEGQVTTGDQTTLSLVEGQEKSVAFTNYYIPTTGYVFVDESGAPIAGDVTFTETNLSGEKTASNGVYEVRVSPNETTGTMTILSVPAEYCNPGVINYDVVFGTPTSFGPLEITQKDAKSNALFKVTLGGHNHGELVAEVPAECEKEGFAAHYRCQACEGYFDENKVKKSVSELTIRATGHDYKNLVPAVPPTCTEEGVKAYRICGCGKYFGENFIEIDPDDLSVPPTGHTFGEWEETKAPTAKEAGEKQRECSVCHHIERGEIPVDTSQGTVVLIAVGGVFAAAVLLFLVTKTDRER